MSIEVKLPDLGDGIESGDVLEIYVSEGDTVTKDQGLLELETDKATVTVPSPQAGKISKILVSPGQSVKIGAVIVQLEASGAASPPAKPTTPSTSAEPPVAKATTEPPKTATPPQPVEPPATAPLTPAVSVAPAATPSASPAASFDSSSDVVVAAAPAIRRFAREVGVDLSLVEGTGEGGRISRDDVLRAVREASSQAAKAKVSSSGLAGTHTQSAFASPSSQVEELPGTPGNDDYGPVRIDRLTKIRKTIAAQMHKSWSTAPHVTNFDDADVTELEAIRVSNKDDYAARGIKLTSMPFLIKAVATALRNHPLMNAKLDMENDQVVFRDYVNVGIAVDTPRGLVVPNIRNAHHLSIADLAKIQADLANRVRNGDFAISDIRGGTFTISNLGAIGGTYSTPIINVPEVAILLVGRTRKQPVVMKDDSIKVRQMMPLSLSYDHRLVDGGTAARFLNEVIDLLETPSRLLLAIA